MINVNCLIEYFLTCPFLKEGASLGLDYLGEQTVSYNLDILPTDEVVKRYSDGSAIKQVLFVFQSKEYFTSNRIDNIENLNFYTKLVDWIKENNRNNVLPIIQELDGTLALNKISQKLEILTSGYLFDNDADKGVYQIQLRLIYLED